MAYGQIHRRVVVERFWDTTMERWIEQQLDIEFEIVRGLVIDINVTKI